MPKEARWAKLQASAKQPTIGKLVDDAMVAIESTLVTAIRQAHEYMAAQAGKAVNISLTLRNWVIGC